MEYKMDDITRSRTSWLAANMGCCASKQDVVDDMRVNAPVSDSQICYEQPQTVPQPLAEPMHHRPSTSHSVSRHVSQWVSNSREYANSSRASISTLTRPRRSHSRPSISRPTDFRHFDGLDGIQSMVDEAPMPVRRRRSFRPLELSIYLPNGCGRLSPLPDFDVEECWESMPAGLELPPEAVVRVRDSRTASLSSNPSTSSYLIQRKPVSTLSRRSSVQSQKSTSTHERHLSGTTMATMATPTLSFLPEEPQSSSASLIEKPTMQRSRTSGTLSPARVLSRLPSPSRNRANTAPSRPSSLRRVRTDVDDAIRELNTIVEERRASAYRSNTQVPALTNRPPPSPSHHVPYIAPSMRMHVRSETLSDIGSAFSAPLANSTLSTPPTTGNAAARRATTALTLFPPPSRTYTGPLTSNPITPPAPVTPTTPITRLGAWLKRSTSTLKSATSTRPTTPKTADSFYQCENPATIASRPSTAGSRTLHNRQDSQDSNTTATVTLYSMSSTRSASPVSSVTTSPPRKTKRVPKPLTLIKDKEIMIEMSLPSARSVRSMVPPASPHYGLLKGMEISAKDVGINGRGMRRSVLPSPGAVGVAF